MKVEGLMAAADIKCEIFSRNDDTDDCGVENRNVEQRCLVECSRAPATLDVGRNDEVLEIL